MSQTHISEVFPEFAFYFSVVSDPRKRECCPHGLIEILFMSVCACLCGCENFEEIEDFCYQRRSWFKRFLTLKKGIPSHDTFERVFGLLDFEQFNSAFSSWCQILAASLSKDKKGQYSSMSIDGKVLRGSKSPDFKSPIKLVSAFANDIGLTLAQVDVPEGSGEICAIKDLLTLFGSLKSQTISIDSIGCQRAICAQIVEEKKGDYVLALKGNQKNLFEDVQKIFSGDVLPLGDKTNSPFEYEETFDRGHGRFEERRFWVTSEIEELLSHHQWPHLKAVGMVESHRKTTKKGEKNDEIHRRYYILSFEANAERFSRAVRSHWAIENQLHWTLDMTFNEDCKQFSNTIRAKNFRVLRMMSMNLLRLYEEKKRTAGEKKRSMKRNKKLCGWSDDILFEVLLGIKAEAGDLQEVVN